MKASEIPIYPLHIYLLNFSDETCRNPIVGGDTLLVSLRYKFSIDNTVSEGAVHASLESDRTDRVERIETIQDVMYDILSPFVNKP